MSNVVAVMVRSAVGVRAKVKAVVKVKTVIHTRAIIEATTKMDIGVNPTPNRQVSLNMCQWTLYSTDQSI